MAMLRRICRAAAALAVFLALGTPAGAQEEGQYGLPLDQDVYDAAAWSAIAPSSETSVANRSRPVDVPDFTRGGWRTREPLGVVS